MAQTRKQKNVVKKWVAALRSGEYKQGYGALSKNGKFCCLGVLCDLAVKAKVIKSEEGRSLVVYGQNYGWPPQAVVKWVGLSNSFGGCDTVKLGGLPRKTLVDLNDEAHMRFKSIANFIESNPKGLFV